MRLEQGSPIAVVGAGPGGLVAAKNLIDAGFDVTVFEAGDAVGGQWHSASDSSGIWPGMRTNTSRAMTAFSDLAYDGRLELHPTAEEIEAYLQRYAMTFDLMPHIRLNTPVRHLELGWQVDGEPFTAVVLASGRFRTPYLPPGLEGFTGRVMHAFDHPGAEAFPAGRALVYGNGVSGHEIAADLGAAVADGEAPVVSAYRRPRYVLQKNVDGVSSDWQWYTHAAALQRRSMTPGEFGELLRERVVRIAGNPADFGAPRPDDDILVAGHSLSQDYLQLVRDGRIRCRPQIATVDGRTVTFTDGSSETVDTIVCATGYVLDLPYLSDGVRSRLISDDGGLRLHHHTLHPELPTLGVLGQFALQGPYFPLLELQARWIAGVWSGAMPAPSAVELGSAAAVPAGAVVAHHALAMTLSEAMGVAPDLSRRPDLVEPLLFGPMLPIRYRLDGPGALPDAEQTFAAQLAASPRAPVEPADLDFCRAAGLLGPPPNA